MGLIGQNVLFLMHFNKLSAIQRHDLKVLLEMNYMGYSLVKLINKNLLFTYLDESLEFECPATNNRIEGGVNAQLRAMLRNHRGLSIERRIKAVFWWCYMHSPNPLSFKEILKVMPINKSISDIYNTMILQSRLESSISTWGDAIIGSDLHNYDQSFFNSWD